MKDDKKTDKELTGDEMDMNAARQLVSGAKQVLYNEDYTGEAGEESDKEADEKKER